MGRPCIFGKIVIVSQVVGGLYWTLFGAITTTTTMPGRHVSAPPRLANALVFLHNFVVHISEQRRVRHDKLFESDAACRMTARSDGLSLAMLDPCKHLLAGVILAELLKRR
jgi:hypothetical protein